MTNLQVEVEWNSSNDAGAPVQLLVALVLVLVVYIKLQWYDGCQQQWIKAANAMQSKLEQPGSRSMRVIHSVALRKISQDLDGTWLPPEPYFTMITLLSEARPDAGPHHYIYLKL